MSVTLTEVQEAFREEAAGLLAKLENKQAKPAPEVGAELVPKPLEGDKAAMQQPGLSGIVDTLDGFRVPGLNISLPVGSALLGGIAGIVVGDVIDQVVPPPRNGSGQAILDLSAKSLINTGVQVGGGWVVLRWGPGLMGRPASIFGVTLIALRVLLRIPAVQNFINAAGDAIATPLKGIVPAGIARAEQSLHGQGVLAEADRIAARQFNDGVDQFARAL